MRRHSSMIHRFFQRRDAQRDPAAPLPPLPELRLAAGTLAHALQGGVHGRRRAGAGETFWQFRPYQPHEPAAAIDWRQSARTPDEQRPWVREREAEIPQPLMIWCDASASMRWRSATSLPSKSARAVLCALALAQAALQGGERVGLLDGRDGARSLGGESALLPLGEALYHDALRQEAPSLPALSQAPPHSAILLVSDFLWDEETLRTVLRQCATRPVRASLLCLLDPAERHLPYAGRVRFSGLEGGTLTLSAVDALHRSYDRLVLSHLDFLRRHCAALRIDCVIHETDAPPLPALLALGRLMGERG